MDNRLPGQVGRDVLRILLLEDRDADAELVERALRKAGFAYMFERARGEADFLARLDPPPHVIVADYYVPGCDALHALRLVRNRGIDVPFILVSGVIGEARALEAMRLGATDFLLKDRLGRLGSAIRTALELTGLRRKAIATEPKAVRGDNEFREAFDNATIGMALTSLDGHWLKVNPAFSGITGFTQEELQLRDCHSITHADDVPEDIELMQRLVAGKISSSEREKRYIHKLGHPVWVHVTASLIRDARRQPLYRVLQVVDISERRQTEARLARANRARKVMAECSHALVHAVDERQFLQAMCRIVVDSGGYVQAYIGMAEDDDRKSVRPVASAGFEQGYLEQAQRSWGDSKRQSVMGDVIATGRRFMTRDISADPELTRWVERARSRGYQALICLPFMLGERCIGGISIYAREPDAFDHEEIELLEMLAQEISYGIGSLRARTELRRSEEHFRATFEQAAVGVAHTTTEGRFLHANGKLCELLGYTRPELMALTMRDLTHPEDRDKQDGLRLELLRGERASFSSEKRYLRKDGTEVWVSRTATMARHPASGEPYLIHVIHDITERKRTEARVERLTRARRVMAECNHTLIHATDETEMLQSMCRIVVDSGGYRMAWVGLPTDDPLKPVSPAAHAGFGADAPMTGTEAWNAEGRYRGFMGEVIATGLPHIARDILHDSRYERRRGRAAQHGFQSSIGLPLKGAGSILGAIAIYAREADAFDDEEIALLTGLCDDIAYGIDNLRTRVAREQAERAARENERRLQESFEQAAVGISRVGLDGVLMDVNQKFCDMLGYVKDELIGKHVRDITHPEDFGKGSQIRTQFTRGTAKAAAGEKRFVRKDGSIMWGRRTMSAACDEAGNPQYVISVVEDITERKEREERYRVMFDNAAVGITRVDLNGILVDINQKFCDLLGYTRDELYGKAIRDVTHPDDFDQGSRFRTRLAQGDGRSASGEKRFVRKDGSIMWARRTMSTALDEAGKPQYVISVVEDITESKAAEEALRQSEERYRDVFEASPLPMWIWDDATLDFVAVNQAAVSHYGYSREEFLRLNVRDIWASGEGTRYEENIRDRAQEQILNLQRKHRTKDGRVIDVELTARRFVLSGRPVWLTVANDISERMRSEAAVRESEERFRATIENAPVGIMHTSIEDDTILQVNPQLCALLGYAPGELLGVNTDAIIHPDYRGVDRSKYRERMLKGEINSFSSERVMMRKDGSAISVNRTVSLVRDTSGKPLYFIRILEDITERTESARRRAMEHAVTSVLAEATTVGEALPMVIRAICEGLDWACGFHWSWDKSSELLRCQEHWYRGAGAIEEFVQASLDMVNEAPVVVPEGATGGLVRRVWASGTPVWLSDVAQLADFRRAPSAGRAGIHGAFAFPVLAEGRPVGIMEFFSHEIREPEQELLQIVQAIGSQLGQFFQRKQTEAALRQSEVQFRQLANNIPQVFWITDVRQKQTLYLSPAAETLIGQPLREIRENPRILVKAVHHEDRARVYGARRAATAGGYDETYRIVRADGSIRWVHDRAFPVHDASGAVYRIAGIAEDITERKLAEERLMHLAHYDVLTSLPNRVLYYDRLRQALAQAKRNQWTVGVMLIDVDRFKNVNDTLGHAVGDRLLQQVSERLTKSVRAGDTVGRLGGDEFAVVLSNLATAQDANLVAQKIMASFKEPFRLDGGAEIYVTGSIGITLYPNDSTDQDTLIKNADAAMYRAKEVGRNSYQFYTPEMNARALELLSMESSLRRALDRGEFLLHYQPKVSVASGDIVGVEALMRWRHPERGLVSPGEFMPVLEETGLIVPVGEWVVRAVCAQLTEWRRQGIDPKAVAINLSARQFVDKDLGPTIQRILEENEVDPSLIELEITESSLMANTEESTLTLEFLAQLGVGLSIDDFGTGYSSLGYLKRFPLDALKIDRSFVRDITTSTDDATITRAVISMAHSLGLKVIAEGVETQEQITFLAEHGCDEFQGYFFSRPLPADECGVWLRERRVLPRPAPSAGAGAPVVLLVDDDNDALTLIRRALNQDSYQILAAYSAQQGMELLGKHCVDVVISDQNMPGTPGIEFLRRVRAQYPGTMRILTSAAELKGVADAVRAGEIFRFLPKGSSEEQVRMHVRDALVRRVR